MVSVRVNKKLITLKRERKQTPLLRRRRKNPNEAAPFPFSIHRVFNRKQGKKGRRNRGAKMAGEEEERNTLIVGMKMDGRGSELLTWALVKIAEAGDRVIAMHVLPADVADSEWNPSNLISLIKHFETALAVYEGFCNLKQIELKMKLCRGSSIRKMLVQEASSVSATKLILGATKNSNIIGFQSVSIAKYCAKKLSRGCLVLAVNNGKIIYEKDTAGNKMTNDFLQKCDSIKLNTSLSSQLTESGESSSFDSKEGNSTEPTSIFDPLINDESRVDQFKKHTSCESEKISLDSDQVNYLGCSSMVIQESLDGRPGWLLLRRAVLNQKLNWSNVKSKASVVKWVMRLPSRYYASSVVHHNHRRAKSDVAEKSGFDEEVVVMPPLSPASVFEELPKELLSLLENYSSVCRLFSYKELLQATSNFSPANIIGKGGTCKVYKGCLPDGKELAFKALRCSDNLMSGFISEIEIITNLHHRNILSLYGFCFENNHLVLVYDLLTRGSLDENLHGIKGEKVELAWDDRYKIAKGVAEALDYLHNDRSREPVIHRDIKSSNILLSDDFKPQLSDFGLAQWSSSSIKSSKSTDCSDLAGTFGYLAPEYFLYGKVDAKIDIYAYGVVLLELLSGRKPICTSRPKGEENLVMWAKPILLSENFNQIVDPSLGDNINTDEMERMCIAASLCISQASHSRPSADIVLKLLKGKEDEVMEWARSELRASMAAEESDDESVLTHSNIQSHINLALLDLEEEDEFSASSMENFLTSNTSLEDYLKARCGRSSSF